MAVVSTQHAVARSSKFPSLICPVTHELLREAADGTALISESGRRYPIVRGVPIILRDTAAAERYAGADAGMSAEYSEAGVAGKTSLVNRLKRWLSDDYKTAESEAALQRVFAGTGLFVAVGGGPVRVHPKFTNLNIGAFPNVDIVADAHELPYEDGTVDAIYVGAVLEHLRRPTDAVDEMFRVLRAGGQVYAVTPFMQPYHGYPHHYQNYTITGHQALFTHAGFAIEEAGVRVGPMFTMVSLIHTALRMYAWRPIAFAWALFGAALRPLDRIFNKRPDAHVLASTTYLVARKP